MKVARDTPVDGSIPPLSAAQHSTFREFIRRHRDETDGRISVNPILLARVLAGDKPAADIDLKGEETHPNFDDPDEYLYSICDTLDLHARKIKGIRSWTVGHSSRWLDLLPTVKSSTDAFHRRCGIVYGYPSDAIENFTETTAKITTYDLIRADIFTKEEITYMTFVPYIYHNSLEWYEWLIERGKEIKTRIGQIATVWDLPLLDEYAQLLYSDNVEIYNGDRGFQFPSMFSPEQTVTRREVVDLLREENPDE